MATLFTPTSLPNYREDETPIYLASIAVLAILAFGPMAYRRFRRWRWERTRVLVDLEREPRVTTTVAVASLETDLLIQSVTPLCQRLWMAAQKGDLSAIRSRLSAGLAERLQNQPGSLIGASPITSLSVVSTSGDSDAIRQFQAMVTTASGACQRWTFTRQESSWLVDDIAA